MSSPVGTIEVDMPAGALPAVVAPCPATARVRRPSRRCGGVGTRGSRRAWILSLILHVLVGLWVADAVRNMIATARPEPDPCIPIHTLPVVRQELPVDDAMPREASVQMEVDETILAPPLVVEPASEPDPVFIGFDVDEAAPLAPEVLMPSHLPSRPRAGGVAQATGDHTSSEGTTLLAMSRAAPGSMASTASGATSSHPAPVQQPLVLSRIQPDYPPLARRTGHEGAVTIAVLLEGDGQVARAEVRTSSGHDELDEAAVVAVRKWRFDAGPAGRSCLVRVAFALR